jgi:hypothetical protein
LNQKSREKPVADSKKPYTKPDFRFEQVFAVAAIQCGKTHATEAQCHHSRKAS